MLRTNETELYDETHFDSMINEITPVVEIMGLSFTPSRIVKELDETAYWQFCNDSQEYRTEYVCPCCLETHDTEDDALECCLDEAVGHYLTAVWFTECGEDDEVSSDTVLSDEANESVREDVKAFLLLTGDIISDLDTEQVMYDFWLSRNHHGSGHFDRGYAKADEDALMKHSHSFGGTSLYVGDDGLGYFA